MPVQLADEPTTEVTEPVGSEPAASEVVEPAATQSTDPEEAFFDAAKVAALDPRLVPTFKEMQAAWTKKTQEYAPYKEFTKSYDLKEVRTFLDTIKEPNGLLNFWAQTAKDLGIPEDKVLALFQPATGSPAAPAATPPAQGVPTPPNPNDPNRAMTWADYQQIQAQQEVQQQRTREDEEVKSLLAAAKIPAAHLQYVRDAAARQPQSLGYAERIKRGQAEVQKMLDGYASERSAAVVAAGTKAPKGLGGSMPGSAAPTAPKGFEDARQRAAARFANQ